MKLESDFFLIRKDVFHFSPVFVLSKLTLAFYRFIHGTLHMRGGGWLLRRFLPFCPGLQKYNLAVPQVGTAVIDLRDSATYSLLNFTLGDYCDDRQLMPLIG